MATRPAVRFDLDGTLVDSVSQLFSRGVGYRTIGIERLVIAA